ncbi:MAG: DNA-protecting protein DprA [Flavobacteriales bacterium]|nr:DNA-protecting protein DprA [Flavobacteriales bacterium]
MTELTDYEKKYQIALSLIEGVGDIVGKKLLAYFGSAKAIFSASKKQLLTIDGIGKVLVDAILSTDVLSRAEQELKWIEKEGVNHLFYADKKYPMRLKQCEDAPLNLFYKGNIDWEKDKFISIVGTRKATSFGKSFTDKLVKELVPYNPVIVSGLAHGIDAAAHKAALKYGLKTIAVFAHGLDRVYPAAHANLAKTITGNGCLLSDYLSETTPLPQNFASRNRIVAGLSDATIVVESAAKGGSLITADIANSYNREVFSVPGNPTETQAKGCNYLIKTQQAILLESAADIVKGLNWDVKEKVIQQSMFLELTKNEQIIIDLLSDNEMHIDAIVEGLDWGFSKVANELLQAEFKGVILSLPGKMYKKNM